MPPLDILFEDAHILAVSKPAGLASQGRAVDEATLEAAVRLHLNPVEPSLPYLGTVHRLDRPVSGVSLWAKSPRAARRLASQFSERSTRKEYWALVENGKGRLGPESLGVWRDWLSDSTDDSGRVRILAAGTPHAREAVTRYAVESGVRGDFPEFSGDGFVRLRLWPETGRTHQLRVQTSARGHPILGDAVYGSSLASPGGIALHARGLEFEHPTLRRRMKIVAPVPVDWGQGPGTRRADGPA